MWKGICYHLYHCFDLFGTGAPPQSLGGFASNGTLSLFEGGGVTCTQTHLRSKVTQGGHRL